MLGGVSLALAGVSFWITINEPEIVAICAYYKGAAARETRHDIFLQKQVPYDPCPSGRVPEHKEYCTEFAYRCSNQHELVRISRRASE